MSTRKTINGSTVAAVAAENAGHPLDAARAQTYAEALEPILGMLDELRALPLKDIEPATTFTPVQGNRDD